MKNKKKSGTNALSADTGQPEIPEALQSAPSATAPALSESTKVPTPEEIQQAQIQEIQKLRQVLGIDQLQIQVQHIGELLATQPKGPDFSKILENPLVQTLVGAVMELIKSRSAPPPNQDILELSQIVHNSIMQEARARMAQLTKAALQGAEVYVKDKVEEKLEGPKE